MRRREFLKSAGAAVAGIATVRRGLGQDSNLVTTEAMLRHDPAGARVPEDFVGLSYELAQLTDPTFFSADNRDLVAYFRLLSKRGVLRLGGNTSEFCWFKANASTEAPKLHVPPGDLSTNWMPHQLFEIRPEAVDALAGFLRATGWRLIYGVNFGNSTPQRAAEEAAYVAAKANEALEYFQIGNEPDLYTKASNGTRPPGWSFADYVREWAGFAKAILEKVPEAQFGGPDVAGSSAWVTQFNAAVPQDLARRVVALSGHYYAEGPPDDPRMTIERLLAGNPNVAAETRAITAAARASGRVYRMTEGNSCYRGGKPGMSDALAAALWASDYMLELASLGCAGANLHGGRSEFLTAGLGGHTPGMQVAQGPQEVQSGFYTPIRSEPGHDVKAMPVFYGMLLAGAFAGTKMMRVECEIRGVNASVYAGRATDGVRVAVINKDARNSLQIKLQQEAGAASVAAWRLQGPSLDATKDVTLAGAEIGAHATWAPQAENFPARDALAQIRVPAASAALVFLR